MSKFLLQICNLKKTYDHKNGTINLFKDVNINVKSGELIALVGPSGSGKSTLTSAMTGKEILSRDLSNNQGVHTTSVSTLYNTGDMQLIDSPGVRDINLDHLKPNNIIFVFSEIYRFSAKCEFPNCNHINDRGCAVIEAVKNGEIEESRYNNFIVLSQRK